MFLKSALSWRALAVAGAISALTVPAAFAQSALVVTNGADTGDGSLRAALEAATAAGGGQIVVAYDGDIESAGTLEYAGMGPLIISGNGQTVQSSVNETVLAATQGADLFVTGLDFAGPGGFDIENRGDLDGAAGKGIFVDVRDDQTGTVTLALTDVKVSGVAGHGIHVSDCSLADACGGGGGGEGEGSPASIAVYLTDVEVNDAGNGSFDADGLRVDERSVGGIRLVSANSVFTLVGADGVELDEGQAGDVVVVSTGDAFFDNGAYCNPDLVGPFMPEEDEGEFEDGERAQADIPGPVTGSPDNTCIERVVDTYDSGFVEEFEFAIDLDDGFDIDEAGPGNIDLTMTGAVINDNLDEGLDFDEEGEGDITFVIVSTEANGNTDDGYKFTEEDGGELAGLMIGDVAKDNGGKGIVLEAEDGGALSVTIEGTMTANNDDSDDTGIEAVGEDGGTLTILASSIEDGIDDDGVDVVQK